MTLNYADIKTYDIANGTGIRTSLFVSGCTHHCKNCFNPETWDFDYGKEFDIDTIDLILQYLEPDYINGLTLIGGDPLCGDNYKELIPLVKAVKSKYPYKNIWCYTGYTYEAISEKMNSDKELYQFIKFIDVLVDGPFIEEKKDLTLKFRGSKNQRLINIQKSLKTGEIVLLEK